MAAKAQAPDAAVPATDFSMMQLANRSVLLHNRVDVTIAVFDHTARQYVPLTNLPVPRRVLDAFGASTRPGRMGHLWVWRVYGIKVNPTRALLEYMLQACQTTHGDGTGRPVPYDMRTQSTHFVCEVMRTAVTMGISPQALGIVDECMQLPWYKYLECWRSAEQRCPTYANIMHRRFRDFVEARREKLGEIGQLWDRARIRHLQRALDTLREWLIAYCRDNDVPIEDAIWYWDHAQGEPFTRIGIERYARRHYDAHTRDQALELTASRPGLKARLIQHFADFPAADTAALMAQIASLQHFPALL